MRALMLIPVLMLVACGEGSKEGTAISISGDNNSVSAKVAAEDGTVAIKAPGFTGSIDLPKIQLDADDFDIDGVNLPDGSKISTLNVADRGATEGVEVRFTSPVDAAAVRGWFQSKLADKGYRLAVNGDALAGTNDKGKSFRLSSRNAGTGSESVLMLGS